MSSVFAAEACAPPVAPRAEVADPQAGLRRAYRKAIAEHARLFRRLGPRYTPPFDFKPFSSLICGARGKRTGRPCPRRDLFGNGRCKFHGGASTGPRTSEGKITAMLNHLKGSTVPRETVEPTRTEAAGDPDHGVRAMEDGASPPKCLFNAKGFDETPRAPDRSSGLQAIRDTLGREAKARWSRGPMTAERIAGRTGLEVGTVQSGLRLLVSMRQVEQYEAGADVAFRLRAGR